jgi:transcriptional regulator with XRE-family HTH domain
MREPFDFNNSHSFGRVLRLRRVALGLRQADVAAAAGCSVVRVSQIERGSRPGDALGHRIVDFLRGSTGAAR